MQPRYGREVFRRHFPAAHGVFFVHGLTGDILLNRFVPFDYAKALGGVKKTEESSKGLFSGFSAFVEAVGAGDDDLPALSEGGPGCLFDLGEGPG